MRQSEAANEFDERSARAASWEAVSPEQRRSGDGADVIIPDPRHEIQTAGGLADFWYLDDGDILCDPRLVRPFLGHFDVANACVDGVPVHAERNLIKSEVIYYADAATLEANAQAWELDEVRRLAQVSTADEASLTLGVTTGPSGAVREQLAQKVKVVRAMHERIAICADTQTEHVLSRQSFGIGRVNHILRVHGHELAQEAHPLEAFDAVTESAMDRLFPGLTPEGREQATLAASVGGLGWRRARDVARAANLGALIMTIPKVRSMSAAAVRAGLLPEGGIEELLVGQVHEVEDVYLSDLDEAERERARDFLGKAKRAAEEQWRRVLIGSGAEGVPAPQANVEYSSAGTPALQGNADETDGGQTDPENASRRLASPHLQKELSRLLDCTRLRALESKLRAQCHWEQLDRLKELRHKETSHQWLWHLDSTKGSVLAEADYIVDVQKRLGARICEGELACRLCGAPLGPQLEHSEVCATAEATRGHYACVRALVEGFRLADPAVTTEPRGLTDTMARPADILTNAAVPGRGAALDVCVASPNAAAALGDAADAAFRRKLRKYRRIIPQLARAGIALRPLVWTSEGRPHPAATRTMRYAARLAAARGGSEATAAEIAQRWRHEVQIAIQRRRAAMARAVLPRASARAIWLLTGRTESVPSSVARAPPLDDDADGGEDDEEAEEMWF